MQAEDQEVLKQLLAEQRWATLACTNGVQPHASMVAIVWHDKREILLHLSQMAAHTRNLLQQPLASIAISERDDQRADPQSLARLSLEGEVEVVERESEQFVSAKKRYLERLPESERLFGFADFVLFRFKPQSMRFVGGFGRAYNTSVNELKKFLD